MTNQTLIFEAEIDGKKFKGQLGGLKTQADKAFSGGTRGAKAFNTEIGSLSVGTLGVVAALVKLGSVASSTFSDLIKRGIELNKTFETSEKVLGQAFGDPELGSAVVNIVDELAQKFRANRGDAQAFAQSILPRSDSLATFTELLRLTDIQADTTGKTFDELAFSIREAVGGDFVSLKEQFDVSKETVNRIKELSKEIGPAAALAKVLGDEFDSLGKSDVSSGTLAGGIKDLQIVYDNFAQDLSEPVFDVLKDQIAGLLDAISENEEEIRTVALAVGDLTSNVVELIGSGLQSFINDTDFQELEDSIDVISEGINGLNFLIGQAGGLLDTLDSLGAGSIRTQSAMEIYKGTIEDINTIIRSAIQIWSAFDVVATLVTEDLGDLVTHLGAELGLVSETSALESKNKIYEKTKNILSGYNDVIENSLIKEKDFTAQQNKRREEQEAATDADRAAVDAVLAKKQADKEAEKSAGELAEANDKVTAATDKLNKAREQGNLDLQIRQERRLTDELIDNARAREDLASYLAASYSPFALAT